MSNDYKNCTFVKGPTWNPQLTTKRGIVKYFSKKCFSWLTTVIIANSFVDRIRSRRSDKVSLISSVKRFWTKKTQMFSSLHEMQTKTTPRLELLLIKQNF